MHSITLMRHGRPNLPAFAWQTAAGMQQWIAAYNAAAIVSDAPPAAAKRLADSVTCRISSPLPRAQTAMAALGHPGTPHDDLYREAALPCPPGQRLRLPPALWVIVFRLLWLAGYAGNSESLQAARQRAQSAADRLTTLAGHGPLLLMGHGIFNRMIGKELRRRGWRMSGRNSASYWQAVTFLPPAQVAKPL